MPARIFALEGQGQFSKGSQWDLIGEMVFSEKVPMVSD